MLHWTLVFLVVALLSAALGFSGVAGISADFARICFFVFLIIFVISTIFRFATGKTPPSAI